eukprot:UN24655
MQMYIPLTVGFCVVLIEPVDILEFEGGRKGMQNIVKSGLFSASCAVWAF